MYTFSNIRVLNEYKSERLMLGTSLQNCTIPESSDLVEPVAKPLELPDCFTTTQAEVEIIDVTLCKTTLLCTMQQESS